MHSARRWCVWARSALCDTQVVEELQKLDVAPDAIDGILAALQLRSVEALEGLLGSEDEAVADLRRLWDLAAAYGCADWLVFDASVVRGLAYYTGGAGECADVAVRTSSFQ